MEVLEFADFTLDIERAGLFRNGRKVELRPKSFDLLRHLAENPDRLISKDELVKVVWQGRIATDESLARCISDVRAALDDGEQRLIETVPRRGYIFKEQTRKTQRARTIAADGPAAVVSKLRFGEHAFAWFRAQLNHPQRVGRLLGVGALLALAIGIVTLRRQPGLEPPVRPSIVVLPFTNQTDERQWDYFATGFSEDIATGLSRYSQLFVISRETAAAYRASEPDARLISSNLGVQYVLRGSLRRTSEHVRITTQLIDGASGKYLWSEQFDKPVTEVFSIQDEIVGRLVATLVATVDRTAIERTRHKHPASLGAYELYLQGRELRRTSETSSVLLAEKLFENAVALDPDFAPAYAELGFIQYLSISTHVDPSRRSEFLEKGFTYTRKAISLAPSLAFSYIVLGNLSLRAQNYSEAEKWARRAIELGPGEAEAYMGLANILSFMGRSSEAIPLMQTAILYDPIRPPLAEFYLARAYALTGQFNNALPLLKSCMERASDFWPCHNFAAISFAHTDRLVEARTALDRFRKLTGIASISQFFHRQTDYQSGPERDRIVSGLRKAGLPD